MVYPRMPGYSMSGTSPPTKSVVGSPYSPSDGLASRDPQ